MAGGLKVWGEKNAHLLPVGGGCHPTIMVHADRVPYCWVTPRSPQVLDLHLLAVFIVRITFFKT